VSRGEKVGLVAAAVLVGLVVGAGVAMLFVSDDCTYVGDPTTECEVLAAGTEWRLLIGAVPTAVIFGAAAVYFVVRHGHRFANRHTNRL
jgi:hypothetical protein